MFVDITLANLANGQAWSSQWCPLLEPWWFTGYSCPTSSLTQDCLFTVSHNALSNAERSVIFMYFYLVL